MDKNLNLNKISKEKVEDVYAGLLIAAIALGDIHKGTANEQIEQIQNSIQENAENSAQFMSAWGFVEKFCEMGMHTERLM